MALQLIPATEAFALVDATPSPLDRPLRRVADAQLGFGLVRPFRRDEKSDFAQSGGVALVRACVGQVLGMRCSTQNMVGELEWDPDRGSALYRLRHAKNDLVLQELGRVYVVETLRRWEPRIRVKGVRVTRDTGPGGPDTVLTIRVVYDVLASNANSNEVLFENVDQTLPIAA